jgi:hypothetical protein
MQPCHCVLGSLLSAACAFFLSYLNDLKTAL